MAPVENHELEVVNFSSKCSGYWTRVQVVNNREMKSVLDYCIMNSALGKKVESMLIDEDKVLCPFRIVKDKKNNSTIQKYSDHNALLVKINITYKDARRETKTENIEG